MQDEALYKCRLLLSEDPGLQVGFKGVQVLTHRTKAIRYRHKKFANVQLGNAQCNPM